MEFLKWANAPVAWWAEFSTHHAGRGAGKLADILEKTAEDLRWFASAMKVVP
jgi:hypothetical protein